MTPEPRSAAVKVPEADGDALEAAQHEKRSPDGRPGQFEPRVPARELLRRDAALKAGERGTEAMVDPERERQVPRRVRPVDPEAVRLVEHRGITVGPANGHDDRRLFRERGYAATSLEQIAEAAEVTKGAIYGHFSSKEDLLLSAIEAAPIPAWATALNDQSGTVRERAAEFGRAMAADKAFTDKAWAGGGA